MRILIVAHRPITLDPHKPEIRLRGGEKSVAIIAKHLALTHEIRIAAYNKRIRTKNIDAMLTWGNGLEPVYNTHVDWDTPYVDMVRWWRNVKLPPEDLMVPPREKDAAYHLNKKHHQAAAAVITNNEYAAKVLKLHFDVDARVSYVPVLGEACGHGSPGGPVVVVTDGKGLGTEEFLLKLAAAMPRRQFLVVNNKDASPYVGVPNIACMTYVQDMDFVYSIAGVLIYPAYVHDVCGTSRVTAEAQRHGVPCLANNRSGLCEKGTNAVGRDADVKEWALALDYIYAYYSDHSDRALDNFKNYDTPAQLRVFDEVFKCLS